MFVVRGSNNHCSSFYLDQGLTFEKIIQIIWILSYFCLKNFQSLTIQLIWKCLISIKWNSGIWCSVGWFTFIYRLGNYRISANTFRPWIVSSFEQLPQQKFCLLGKKLKFAATTLTCQIIVQQILLIFRKKNTYTTLLGPTRLLISEIFPSKPDFHLYK